jgi:tetratricopeptide (TPR) repeat protein
MSDASVPAIRDLLKAIVDAPTWQATSDLVGQYAEQLLTDYAALHDLDAWIAEVRQIGDAANVERLTFYQKIFELCGKYGIEVAFEQLPALLSLDQLLRAWISTDTWPQSKAFLQTFSEQLLSDEALALLTTWLEEQQNEPARNILLQHRSIGEKARAESINAAYADLLERAALGQALQSLSPELRQALHALIEANSPAEVGACVQSFPLLLTSEATGVLDALLETFRTAGKEQLVAHIEERYHTLLQVLVSAREQSAEMQLLIDWINTETWEQSKQMLLAHTDRLLSEETETALAALLERREANERRILLLHQQILATARSDSIDMAYQELQAALAQEAAFNALLQADSPRALRKAIEQHPLLLVESTWRMIAGIAEQTLRDGNADMARVVQFRLDQVKIIWRQRQEAEAVHVQETQEGQESTANRNDHETYHTQADTMSIAIGNMRGGSISQTNIENYALPPRRWQKPPHQPRLKKSFIGRRKELELLKQHLSAGKDLTIASQGVAVLWGMAGIGKTYLARKLAADLEAQFPAGVIWITCGENMRSVADAGVGLAALAGFAFGASPIQLDSSQLDPEKVRGWLEETAPGRLLVVFDDVWYQDPLNRLDQALPASAVRLITTRNANIARFLQGYLHPLEQLLPEDGLGLLEDRLQTKELAGLDQYQEPLKALVKLLDGHALALDIVAALIRRPAQIESILHALENEISLGNLDRLSVRDRTAQESVRDTHVRLSLTLSYKDMELEEQRCFRVLGVFASSSIITLEAAAVVWEVEDLLAAERILENLETLALLSEVDDDTAERCYQQHSLLRTYAYELLKKEEEEYSRACWAHASYYTQLIEHIKVADAALVYQALPNIFSALEWTASQESTLFVRLIESSFQYLLIYGQWKKLKHILPQALIVAQSSGNRRQQTNVLRSLGDLEMRLGQVDEARGYYDTALPLYRVERDRLGEANVLRSLGDLERRLGQVDEAREHYDGALPLYRAERDRLGEANVLVSLGDLASRLGQVDEAREHYDGALPLYRAERASLGEANVLRSLGDLASRLGQVDEARGHYDGALRLYRVERARLGEANVLMSLGDLERRLGQVDEAREHYDGALPLYRAERDRLGEANVLRSLGDLCLSQQEWADARNWYKQALPLFQAEQEPLGQAYTLLRLGQLLGEQGMEEVQAALALFKMLKEEKWIAEAEQTLQTMRDALARPDGEISSSPEAEILQALLAVSDSQTLFELVQRYPQLISDPWLAGLEALVQVQEEESGRQALQERLDALKDLKEALDQIDTL